MTRHIPPQPIEETKRLLGKSLDHLLSYGITGLVEAVAMREDLAIYADLADKGALKQHVQACIATSMAGHGNSELDATIADIPKYTRERFKPTCVKVLTDGVPTDSHTNTGSLVGTKALSNKDKIHGLQRRRTLVVCDDFTGRRDTLVQGRL